jgi:hypothetical protein
MSIIICVHQALLHHFSYTNLQNKLYCNFV